MARKSRELRLTQTKTLIEAYEAAGLGNDRNCRFAQDMEWRLSRNKGLSPKRREWLDSIIEEGVPTPKGDLELLARVEVGAAVKGMTEFDTGILTEFAGKIRRGWDLSPKQTAWMDKLLAKADDIVANGVWAPDDETTARLQNCVKLALAYSSGYWATHGGTAKALNNVKAFLDNTTPVDEWSVNKLIKAMARPLRELETPKFEVGEMRWHYVASQGYATALVSEGPFINDRGQVVYAAWVNGTMIETANLTKQRRR